MVVDADQSSKRWELSKRTFSQPVQTAIFQEAKVYQGGPVSNVLPNDRPCETLSKHSGLDHYKLYDHI